MALELVRDPRDGREKVVLGNWAGGEVGSLVFIEPASGEGEALLLPGDEGPEGLLNLDNRKLLVGTSEQYGYLHSLDLSSCRWAKPLRDPKETYIWNLCRGSDGMIYGGTYPGCVLLRYDPIGHTLTNLGRMSEDKDNLYTRWVYGGLHGYILVYCGLATPHLTLYDIKTRTARPFGKPRARVREIMDRFLCTDTDGKLDFYDITTLKPIPEDLTSALTPPWQPPYAGTGGSGLQIKLSNTTRFAVRGQEYYVAREGELYPPLKPIPAEAPATMMFTVTCDPAGKIWGSCSFGQTIFSYDPASGKSWNSPAVCNAGGEVYGMAFAGDKLFMTAYCGGDHIVYDPAQPWDQIGNINPRALQPVGPALIRPESKSVIGPDGNFWTGWMAQYGKYGGGLSRVDVRSLRVTSWCDPVPEQAVTGLTADNRYLYFITGGSGNGLPNKSGPFHFVVWDPAGGIVWQRAFDPDVWLGGLLAVSERVILKKHKLLEVFNPQVMAFERAIPMDEPVQAMVALPDGAAALFCSDGLWRIDPLSGEKRRMCALPGVVHTAAMSPNGELFFACGSRLYAGRF